MARDGKVIDLTASTSACNGGTWHLGLGEHPKGEEDRALKEFLVNGEKLYCSIATFHRAQVLSTAPSLGLANHIILSPLDRAEFQPDAVLFICNAQQACRLVTLDSYDTGIPPGSRYLGQHVTRLSLTRWFQGNSTLVSWIIPEPNPRLQAGRPSGFHSILPLPRRDAEH